MTPSIHRAAGRLIGEHAVEALQRAYGAIASQRSGHLSTVSGLPFPQVGRRSREIAMAIHGVTEWRYAEMFSAYRKCCPGAVFAIVVRVLLSGSR
jgi:hypothetical protein